MKVGPVQAKSKVSPVNKLSIPGLKLLSSTTRARLSVEVIENVESILVFIGLIQQRYMD